MASRAEWVEGARPRTLPAAISPVLSGTGIAIEQHAFTWWKALLALIVALALQIGVNYANDYSDGIRGTDSNRVGPLRLVGSGAAPPARVRHAAMAAFAVAAAAGVVLAATTAWWLIAVGAAAVVAAWFYTGGRSPYGYRGLGEVSVFVFFGLVAGLFTTYVQTQTFPLAAWCAAVGVGALACAILVANNLRDIPTDAEAGKRTLAVLLGDAGSRSLYGALLGLSLVALVAASALASWWLLLGLLFAAPAARAQRAVSSGQTGPALIPVLRDTGLAELTYAVALLVGCVIAVAA